ncbi:hypothetical protein EDD85DRAFT_1005822 [Armillaria nabsnona]|nr:hypothetical protein EDD85DRAFT_1005822 [Armillaria nabsnona]
MATQANIPSDLPDADKASIFQLLDAELNSRILFALLYGIYTGIFGVTLWNIFINKCWPIRRAMVVVIILLHALITISFAVEWSFVHSEFVENGRSFWTVYLRLDKGPAQSVFLAGGIASSISTILTDLYMIWYCWIVWGRRWVVVLLPILFLISATVSKIIKVYLACIKISSEIFAMLYISCVLATTLWCTVLIIYRILTVAGVKRGAGGRLRVYQHFIEVLVESSAFYSISLIVYLVLTICGNLGSFYLDIITGIVKGVASTLIVGRIAAGHRARPDDSWQGSVIGSASIRSCSQEHSRTSFQEDVLTSPMLSDLEAQRRISVREPSPTAGSGSVMADISHPNTDVSPETTPHLGNRSLFHDRPSPYGDVACGYTVVDDATTSSR